MSWHLMIEPFVFPAYERFVNRGADLARLDDWWNGDEKNALALYGCRRVGKSWLFRRFAHGKRALLLVADRRAEAPQLERFADQLAEPLGVRPSLPDLPALIAALYRLAAEQKLLVVIDEFPYLLPARETERLGTLTAIQAVMEERDASQLKLVLCGFYITQMERLLKGPLRGRLTPLHIEPLGFADAQQFAQDQPDATVRVERYAVSGGMALYLDELSRGRLSERICSRVLDPRGPLFNDPREVLEEELRSPGVYYSLLEDLATGKKSLGDLGTALGRKTTDLQGYLDTLRDMRVVDRSAPVTARDDTRDHRYRLADDYLRFWFRFVFPFQDDLKTGLATTALWRDEIAPALADHVSPAFEALCREWVLRCGFATRVGAWWGNALNEHRRSGTRQTEEIDIVGLSRSRVVVTGECKWTNAPLGLDVLRNLETFKLPALRQAKVQIASGSKILLFSKSGFADDLIAVTAARDDLQLISVGEVTAFLIAGR